jgi:hypothetical protein
MRGETTPNWQGKRAVGNAVSQGLQEPTRRHRAGARQYFIDAWRAKRNGLLPGDDLREFSGWHEHGRLRQYRLPTFGAQSNLVTSGELSAAGVPVAVPEGIMKSAASRRPKLRLDHSAYRGVRQQVLQRDGRRCQGCPTCEVWLINVTYGQLCSRFLIDGDEPTRRLNLPQMVEVDELKARRVTDPGSSLTPFWMGSHRVWPRLGTYAFKRIYR